MRDPQSQRKLDDLGVSAALHPDLVTLLPTLNDYGKLPFESDSGEILLQVSHAVLATWGAELARAVAPLATRFSRLNIGIAGIAPYHDRLRDTLDLANTINDLVSRSWAKPTLEIHPLDIARRISSSTLVVASSLHYRILAMAYGVPGVSIGVEKAMAYSEHWDLGRFGALEAHDLQRQVQAALEPLRPERLEHAAALQGAVITAWREAIGGLR